MSDKVDNDTSFSRISYWGYGFDTDEEDNVVETSSSSGLTSSSLLKSRIERDKAAAAARANQKSDTSSVSVSGWNGDSSADASFDGMLAQVLKYEGGYSNHPNDSGGETNKGITHSTYDSYRRSKGLSPQSVKNITDQEVKDIYYNNYYVASGAANLEKTNPKLAFALFDAAVNHGIGGAQRLLSQSGNDVDKFMSCRRQYYYDIVARNSSQSVFLNGWMNRMSNVQSYLNSIG